MSPRVIFISATWWEGIFLQPVWSAACSQRERERQKESKGRKKRGKGKEGRDQETGQLGFTATSFSLTAQSRDVPRNCVTVLEPCSSNSAYLKCDILSREGGTAA